MKKSNYFLRKVSNPKKLEGVAYFIGTFFRCIYGTIVLSFLNFYWLENGTEEEIVISAISMASHPIIAMLLEGVRWYLRYRIFKTHEAEKQELGRLWGMESMHIETIRERNGGIFPKDGPDFRTLREFRSREFRSRGYMLRMLPKTSFLEYFSKESMDLSKEC